MHHHFHAVAGTLRNPNVGCPHPDVSTGHGWPVIRSTLSSHSTDISVLICRRSNGYSFASAPMGAVRIRHSIWEFATQPVILWILLGGKPKWLPLNFGFNDVKRTAPISSLIPKNIAIDLKCIENHMAVHCTASSELQVGLLPRLSRNLSRCCEKEGLSAPSVGFSNFEFNYLVFSSTSTTKRLHRWSKFLVL